MFWALVAFLCQRGRWTDCPRSRDPTRLHCQWEHFLVHPMSWGWSTWITQRRPNPLTRIASLNIYQLPQQETNHSAPHNLQKKRMRLSMSCSTALEFLTAAFSSVSWFKVHKNITARERLSRPENDVHVIRHWFTCDPGPWWHNAATRARQAVVQATSGDAWSPGINQKKKIVCIVKKGKLGCVCPLQKNTLKWKSGFVQDLNHKNSIFEILQFAAELCI